MLTKLVQVLSKFEKIEGTPDVTTALDALAASDGLLGLDVSVTEQPEQIALETVQSTLSREATLEGIRSVSFQYGLYLRGDGLTDKPEWDRLIRGGGFRYFALSRMTMDAIGAGSFRVGEQLIWAEDGQVPSAISKANPCQIDFGAAHGYGSSGTVNVVIDGVTGGSVDIDGCHAATVVDSDSISIPVDTSAATGTYSGGTVYFQNVVAISAVNKASPTTIDCARTHNKTTTWTVELVGVTRSDESDDDINGTYTATTVDTDTFSIPVDTSTATGTYSGGYAYITANARSADEKDYSDGETLFFFDTYGTPDAAQIMGGLTTGAYADIETAKAEEAYGHGYRPTSEISAEFTDSAWSSGQPDPGDTIKEVGTVAKYGRVQEYNTVTNVLRYEPLIGDFENGDSITIAAGASAGSTATILSTPALTRSISTTEEIRQDGMMVQMAGCRNSPTITLPTGQPATVRGDWTGTFLQRVDEPLATLSTTSDGALLFRGATFRIRDSAGANYPFCVSSVEIAMNSQLSTRACPEAAYGAKSARQTDRDPTVTLDPEMVTPGIFDWFSKWRNQGTIEMAVVLGSTTGNRIVIWGPHLQITSIADGDRDGNLVGQITAGLRKWDAGDDELFIFVT